MRVLISLLVLLTATGCASAYIPVQVEKIGVNADGTPIVTLKPPAVTYLDAAHGMWVRVSLDGHVTFDATPPIPDPKDIHARVFSTDGKVIVFGPGRTRHTLKGSEASVSIDHLAFVSNDGRIEIAPLLAPTENPTDSKLTGHHPYAVGTGLGSVYLAFTRNHEILLAVLGSTYSLRPTGFTDLAIVKATGKEPKTLGTWTPPVIPLEDIVWNNLRTLASLLPGAVIPGVPVNVGSERVWVFPTCPVAPVLDDSGNVVGESACLTSHPEVTAIVKTGDHTFTVAVCEGPTARVIAERSFQGSNPIVGVPGPCDEGALTFAFKDENGVVEVGLYDGHGFRTVEVGPGTPLALAAGFLFYRAPDGTVRCVKVTTEPTLRVTPVEPERVDGLLKAGPVLFDPSSGRAYIAPSPRFLPHGYVAFFETKGLHLKPLAHVEGEGLVPAVELEGDTLIGIVDGRPERVRIPTTHVSKVVSYVGRDGILRALVLGENPVLVEFRPDGPVVEPVLGCGHGRVVVRSGNTVKVLPAPVGGGEGPVVYRLPDGRLSVIGAESEVTTDHVAVIGTETGVTLGTVAPDGEDVFVELRGFRLEDGALVTPGGLRLDPARYLTPVASDRWYVVKDITLNDVPDAWEHGSTLVRVGGSTVTVEGKDGRVVVDVETPLGRSSTETPLEGRPLAAGWNGLLTVVYRAPDGTVHAALLSPWPVVGLVTDSGVRVLIADGEGWKEGPLLPPTGNATRRYLPAHAIALHGTVYFVLDGFVLDHEGHVVGHGHTLTVDDRLYEIAETFDPTPGVAVPALPVSERKASHGITFPEVKTTNVEAEWKTPDGTRVILTKDGELIAIRDHVAYILNVGPGWKATLKGHTLTLRRGSLTLTLTLDPWPIPATRAVPTGDGVRIETLKNGSYAPIATVPTSPRTGVTPLTTTNGRVLALVPTPDGPVVWTGDEPIPCGIERGPDAWLVTWPEDDTVHAVPTLPTPLGPATGPELTLPGRPRAVAEGMGTILLVTDRSALLLTKDGTVGIPVYLERLPGDRLLAVFRTDDRYVATLTRGTHVLDVKTFEGFTVTPEDPLAIDHGRVLELKTTDDTIEEIPTPPAYPGPQVVLPAVPLPPYRRRGDRRWSSSSRP